MMVRECVFTAERAIQNVQEIKHGTSTIQFERKFNIWLQNYFQRRVINVN